MRNNVYYAFRSRRCKPPSGLCPRKGCQSNFLRTFSRHNRSPKRPSPRCMAARRSSRVLYATTAPEVVHFQRELRIRGLRSRSTVSPFPNWSGGVRSVWRPYGPGRGAGRVQSPLCAASMRMLSSGRPSRPQMRAQNSHGPTFWVILSISRFHPAFSVMSALSV